MTNLGRYCLAVFVGIFIGGIIYITAFTKKPQHDKNAVSPSEVMSCVRNVRVIDRRIDDASASLIVEVENTSDLGIVSISLESKKGNDSYTVRPNTFEADDSPVIIKPHERYELRMNLANIMPQAHLQIGSVIYTDGTEDGCEASIQASRKSKAYHEEIKASRKRSK